MLRKVSILFLAFCVVLTMSSSVLAETGEGTNELKPSQDDKVFLGVCGGLGDHLGIDSDLIRIGFVVLTIASLGIGILAYFLIYIVIED